MDQNSTGMYWLAGIVVVALVAAFAYFALGGYAVPGASETPQEAEAASSTPDGASSGSSAAAPKGKLPVAKTVGFASVSSTTAVVIGSVVPLGASATYWFEYGTSTSFGSVADVRSVGVGSLEIGASAALAGLKPGTEYYFRLAAQNAYGRTYGGVYKLITASK